MHMCSLNLTHHPVASHGRVDVKKKTMGFHTHTHTRTRLYGLLYREQINVFAKRGRVDEEFSADN